MSPQSIEKLLKSKEGLELIKFIKSMIRSLDRVSDIPAEWDDRKKAIEIAARIHASRSLAEILKPFLNYQEPGEQASPQEDPIYYDHLAKK